MESLEFPEAVGNELTLRRALGALVDTALARPERRDRFVRKLALAARLVGGGSWRRTLTLREPSADAERIRVALAPRLAELPAPVVELRLELVELTEPAGHQLELLAAGAEDRSRLREGLRQVRASTGSGSVCTVVEVAPWSRIPETRALVRPAGRLNEPRPARVEANFDGTPWQVNHQPSRVLREEWRVARPLVDGGAGRPPLLRGRARDG